VVYTEMRGTFVTGRWNVDVFGVMDNGVPVDRVELSLTRNRPQTLLEGVP